MSRKIVVLQHNSWEGPGQFLRDGLRRHKITVQVVPVWKERIPPLNDCLAMIVLGGGPNVDQEHIYPFLAEEKKKIRKAIALDLPYLGFCLGHQLLADALGVSVGPNFQASVGYTPGFLTHEGKKHPVFKGLPQSFPLFKWHSQAVQEPLPASVAILVTSAACQVEAISLHGRPHILGLQFDNHAASPENVKNWLAMDSKWLATLRDRKINGAGLLGEAEQHQAAVESQFAKLIDNFLSLIQ